MYLVKNKASLYKKLGIIGAVLVLVITSVGIAIWKIPSLMSYPKLADKPYSFEELGNADSLSSYMTDVARTEPKNNTGFLLDLSTSACPICHGIRDLNRKYYDYYANYVSKNTAKFQDEWLKNHGLGNGPLNDYAMGSYSGGTTVNPHNVKSIWIDGYDVEDSAGFNFQNNPFYHWAWELITNKTQLIKTGTGTSVSYNFASYDVTSDPYDGSYGGWLNNNVRAGGEDLVNHWFYLKKLSKKDKDHNYVIGWNRGYYTNDTEWFSKWPLLVWITYDAAATTPVWKVTGWTTGYYDASTLQDLSSKINADDQISNNNDDSLSQNLFIHSAWELYTDKR